MLIYITLILLFIASFILLLYIITNNILLDIIS